MSDHDVEAFAAKGESVHARLSEIKTPLSRSRARLRTHEHRRREIEADDVQARFSERYRVASGPAAEVEHLKDWLAPPLAFDETDQGRVWRRLRKPGHGGGPVPR